MAWGNGASSGAECISLEDAPRCNACHLVEPEGKDERKGTKNRQERASQKSGFNVWAFLFTWLWYFVKGCGEKG